VVLVPLTFHEDPFGSPPPTKPVNNSAPGSPVKTNMPGTVQIHPPVSPATTEAPKGPVADPPMPPEDELNKKSDIH
jgi:hypothetical protein